jgi:hypothetical protein
MKTAVKYPDIARSRSSAKDSSFQRFSFQRLPPAMPVSTSSDSAEFAIAHAAFSFTKSPFSPVTPISPPSGPTQWLFQGPPAESKFLAVGAGTGFSDINFSATLAANEGHWDNSDGNFDEIKFEVFLNSAAVAIATRSFKPTGAIGSVNTSLALDTNSDGIGDGLAITTGGAGFTITNAGGAGITTIEVRASFTTDVSVESYWTFGALSADYDMVPEPSSPLLFGLRALEVFARRSRNGYNFSPEKLRQ